MDQCRARSRRLARPGAPQRRTGGAAQQRQHRARPGQPGGRERRGRHPERRQGPGRPGRRSAAGGRIGGVARRAGAGRRAGRARRGRRRQADPAGQPDPRGARRAARPGRARRLVGAGGQRLRAGLLAIRTDRHARPGSRRRRAAARLDAAAAPGAGRRRRDGQDAGPAGLDAAALPGRRGQERADAAQGRQPDPAERHAADRAERAVPRRPDAGGRFAGGGRPGTAHQSGRHRPDHAERHAAGLVGPHRGDRAARHDHGRDDGDRLRPLALGRRTRCWTWRARGHGGQPQGPVLRPAAGWRQHHAGRRGQRRQGQRGRAGPVHRAAAGQPAGRIRRLRQPAGQRRAGGRRQRRRADRHQLGQRPVPGRTDDRAFGRRRRGRRPPGAGAGHAGIQEQRDPGPGQGAARLRAVGQGDGGLACRAGQSRHGRRQAGLWPRHAGRRPAGARRLRRAGPAVQRSAQLRRRRHAEPGPEPAPVQPDPRHDARCRADGARSAGRALHHAGRRHRRQ